MNRMMLGYELPSVVEPDMNPVIVTPNKRDCRVVDAKIRVEGDG